MNESRNFRTGIEMSDSGCLDLPTVKIKTDQPDNFCKSESI